MEPLEDLGVVACQYCGLHRIYWLDESRPLAYQQPTKRQKRAWTQTPHPAFESRICGGADKDGHLIRQISAAPATLHAISDLSPKLLYVKRLR